MSLEALGNLGDFIGSVGVLISLVYLAIEVRKNTETSRTSTYRAIVSDFGELNQVLLADPELSFVFAGAMEDFDSLEPSQRARIAQAFYMTFRHFENMYYQRRSGYLEDELWIGWKRLMLTYHGRPGCAQWWRVRKTVFSPSFVAFLEQEEIDQPIASYLELSEMAAGPPASG